MGKDCANLALTGVKCKNCEGEDVREFKGLERYKAYVCPKCSGMWIMNSELEKEVSHE
jgi:Zn-finger nucleic acid-binding protein